MHPTIRPFKDEPATFLASLTFLDRRAFTRRSWAVSLLLTIRSRCTDPSSPTAIRA